MNKSLREEWARREEPRRSVETELISLNDAGDGFQQVFKDADVAYEQARFNAEQKFLALYKVKGSNSRYPKIFLVTSAKKIH